MRGTFIDAVGGLLVVLSLTALAIGLVGAVLLVACPMCFFAAVAVLL